MYLIMKFCIYIVSQGYKKGYRGTFQLEKSTDPLGVKSNGLIFNITVGEAMGVI